MQSITLHDKFKENHNAEICNECGISVTAGTGFFTNRVVDLNDESTRNLMGKPFPNGDYICAICDDKTRHVNVK